MDGEGGRRKRPAYGIVSEGVRERQSARAQKSEREEACVGGRSAYGFFLNDPTAENWFPVLSLKFFPKVVTASSREPNCLTFWLIAGSPTVPHLMKMTNLVKPRTAAH